MDKTTYNPKTSVAIKVRRKEHRYNYSMPITFRTKARRFQATTVNVSSSGIKFISPKDPRVSISDFVYINMPELIEYLNSLLQKGEEKEFELFMYEVVYIQQEENETIIACQYVGQSNEDLLKLESYVEQKLKDCRIDHAHNVKNIKYHYYEHLCFNEISYLAFYIAPTESRTLFLKSNDNQYLYDFLSQQSGSEVDLNAFLAPDIQKHFITQTQQCSEFVLFIYWSDNELNYIYDFEISSPDDLNMLLQKTINHNGKVLKGHTCLADFSKEAKTDAFTFPLGHANEIHQAIFNDMTDFVRYSLIPLLEIEINEQKDICSSSKSQKITSLHEVFILNAYNMRREKRYLYKSNAILYLNKETSLNVIMVDFSTTGLSLQLDGKYLDIKNKSNVWIDFTDLNKTMKKLELKKIPFIIQNVVICNETNTTTLGLNRLESKCSDDINHFFYKIIEKNKTKLPVCTQEKLNINEKQRFLDNLKKTSSSIPIFLSYKDDALTLKEVKIYNENCRLSHFFEVAHNQFDFSCLTRQPLIQRLDDYIHNDDHVENPLLGFFIIVNNKPKIMTSAEMNSQEQLLNIAQETLKREGVCVLMKYHGFDRIDNQALEKFYQTYNLTDASEIDNAREKAQDIYGYIELIDITTLFKLYLK